MAPKSQTWTFLDLSMLGVSFDDTNSEAEEAEDDRIFGDLEFPPYDYTRRVWRRKNQRKTAREVFGPPSKRRRLQELAKAAVEQEKTLDALECACRELPKALHIAIR